MEKNILTMKNLKRALCGFFAAAMLAGCTSDDLPVDNPQLVEGEGDGFFMSLDILMPNGRDGSRSATNTPENGDETSSDAGTEVGSDAENAVSSALIVLARENDFGFIAAGEVASNRLTELNGANDKSYRALTRIYKTNLNNFYEALDNPNVQPTVYVFVFCNPTSELTNMFKGANTSYGDTDWINTVCKVSQGNANTPDLNNGIWGANSFLMNNVKLTKRALPANILDWEKFDKAENAFHLSASNAEYGDNMPDNSDQVTGRGAVRVQRSVARFDFRDGSKNGDQTYNVLFHSHNGVDQENEPLVSVTLQRMALVNMSNAFYYLPRVSDDGQLNGANYALCGAEKAWGRNEQTGVYGGGNYVVGPYASIFGGDDLLSGFENYFNYSFFENDGTFNNSTMIGNRWDTYKVTDVLDDKRADDNYESADGSIKKGSYKVWRYVTENVIPAGPAKQQNGISTGIVFKARLNGTPEATSLDFSNSQHTALWEAGYYKNIADCLNGKKFDSNGAEHKPIVGNSKEDPILYYLDGHLYLTWNHIRQAAIQASVAYNAQGVLEINRSNSLYRAVFGDGPIPNGNKYLVESGQTVTPQDFIDPQWNADVNSAAYKNYMNSADYAWSVWDKAGKPVPDVVGVNVPETLTALRLAVTGAGITMYQSSVDPDFGAGYYCYYYYWNRHNDNGLNGVMGPMEFDVVRNNVYKLSVDKISRLGHPRIPGNDPNQPRPDTPDESDEIYLDVTVQITPWAVRLNSIEF